MSNVPFAFDVDKLIKFINGDLGIADAIHKAQVSPIANKTQTQKDKDIFNKLQTPNKQSGIWSVEKAFISASLESQKPYIELVKIVLELFGHIEMTTLMLSGGPNPLNIQNSFINSFKQSKSKMSSFKTGFEPVVKPVLDNPILPDRIFLMSIYQNNSDYYVGSPDNSSNYSIVNTSNNQWPQYQDYNLFYNEQLELLNSKISSIDDAETKNLIITSRLESIGEEWTEMETKNQLKEANSYGYIRDQYKKYFIPQTISYLNNDVDIDPEEDYNIKFNFNDIGDNTTRINIWGELKDGINNNSGIGTSLPPVFSSKLVKAVKYFIKNALKVIIDKLIPVLQALKKVISKPVDFIGNILMSKIKEHFEMLDPSLRSKDEYDPKRRKYWSGDKFVLDGLVPIKAGILNITVGLDKAIPSFKVGKQAVPKDNMEPAVIKMITNLVALPINFLKGIFDIFTNLFKSLFKINQLPGVYANFITLKSFKDLVALPKILEFLGAEGGDITKIPFLNIPKEGMINLVPQQIQAFLKMIIQFINGFIGIPNTIMNVELVPKIPVPD